MRLLVLLLILVVSGCGPDHDSLAGRYQARRGQGPAVSLELEDDGSGSWTVEGGASMSFSWSEQRDRVVLRTKTGGLVAGERHGDAIMLKLPGVERLTFLPARQ